MPLNAAASSLTPDHATTSAQHGGGSKRGSHRLASTACETLWTLRTMYGLVAKYDPPLRLGGTLIHTCLAYHYAGLMPDATRPAWAKDRTMFDALADDGEGAPDLIRLAQDVYAAYRHRYASDTWTPLFVEEEFEATIGELDPGGPDPSLDNEVVTCRTDLVVLSNGDAWIVDHKSTGGREGARLEAWKSDGEWKTSWQIMLNLLILRTPRNVAKLGGRRIRGFVIQRVKQRTPFDFDRNVVHVSSKAYASAPRYARECVRKEREIHAKVSRGEKPIPNFSACHGRYGPCDYAPLCGSDNDAEQQMVMDTMYRDTRAGARTGDPSIVQIGSSALVQP